MDYADIVWSDQQGLKSEMEQLQFYQNRFAKKIQGGNHSSTEAHRSFNWLPLAAPRFRHRCIMLQNVLNGNITEHFECFKTNLRHSHGYNIRGNKEWGIRTTYFKIMKDWVILPNHLKKLMPQSIFMNKLQFL